MDLQSMSDSSDFNPRNPSGLVAENNLKSSLDESLRRPEADLLRQIYMQPARQQASFPTAAASTTESIWTLPGPFPHVPPYHKNNLQDDYLLRKQEFLKRHQMGNIGGCTFPEARVESVLQADDWRQAQLSPRYPYYGQKSAVNAVQRAFLSSEARENSGCTRESLMSDTPRAGSFRCEDRRVDDGTVFGEKMMHRTLYADEWDDCARRRAGKSQPMRSISTFDRENQLLREAFHAMKQCDEQPYLTATANLKAHACNNMTGGGTRSSSIREAYQMGAYSNCCNGFHSSPAWNGGLENLAHTLGFSNHGEQHADGMFYKQERDMLKTDRKFHNMQSHVIGTPEVPLVPVYNRNSIVNPNFLHEHYDIDGPNAGHNIRQAKRGGEEQYHHSSKMVERARASEQSQSMRYNNVCFSDDLLRESMESCAKIDGTRTHSMREMTQCWACGQRLWVTEGVEVLRKVVPATVKQQQQHQHQQQQQCSSCNRAPATSINPRSSTVAVGGQHKMGASAPPRLPLSSSSSSSTAAPGFLSAPPPCTIAIGCNPSTSKKKTTRIIRLCRQFLGLAEKN